MVCDFQGMITAANPAVTRILGWEEDDFVGHNILTFIHPEDLERSRAQLGRLLEGQPMLGFENRFRARSGDHRVIAWAGVPEAGRIHSVRRDMPGGYHTQFAADDVAEGAIYDRAVYIYTMGRMSRDELGRSGR